MEQSRRKACAVQGGPEAVAGTREVVAGGGRVQAGVDAAEENFQARRDYILEAFVDGGGEIGFRRLEEPPAALRSLPPCQGGGNAAKRDG
jgi:hypothetical protein